MNKRLAMYREGIIKSFYKLLYYTINKLYVYTQCKRMTLTNVLDAVNYAGTHSGLNILYVYIYYTQIYMII